MDSSADATDAGATRPVRDEVQPNGEWSTHEGGAEPAGGHHPADAVCKPGQHPGR